MPNRNNAIYSFIKWIITLIPIFMVIAREFVEGFAYTSIIQARIYIENERIIINPFNNTAGFYAEHVNSFSFRPVPGLTIAILSIICNIDANKILFYPLLGILSIILVSLWIRVLIKNQLLANLFTLTITFSYAFIRTSVFFYYIPYGILMLLIFIYILHKNYLFNSLPRFQNIIILLVLFSSSLFSYYSSSALIILSLITLIILSKLFAETRFKYLPQFLALSLIIVYLSFEQITYNFMYSASIENVLKQFLNYFDYLIKVISNERYFISERPQFANPLTFYSDFVHRSSLTLIILVYLVFYLSRKIRESNKKTYTKISNGFRAGFLILFSLLFAGFFETLLYSLVGFFPFLRLLYLAFVMLAFYLASEICTFRSNFASYLALVLAIIAFTSNVVHFSSFITNPRHPFIYPYQKVRRAVDWFTDYADKGVILTFHEPAANLFEMVVAKNKSDKIYVNVIYPETSMSSGAYILLGEYEVVGMGWEKPILLSEIDFITHLEEMNKIFVGSLGEIYQVC